MEHDRRSNAERVRGEKKNRKKMDYVGSCLAVSNEQLKSGG